MTVIASRLNPDWVTLNTSRGYESYEHKLFMRYTVLVADVTVFFSAVFACTACVLFRGKSDMVQQVSEIVSILYCFRTFIASYTTCST